MGRSLKAFPANISSAISSVLVDGSKPFSSMYYSFFLKLLSAFYLSTSKHTNLRSFQLLKISSCIFSTMKTLLFATLPLLFFIEGIHAEYEERYNLNKLPPDLRPIMELIGLWQLETRSGPTREYSPPDLIDIAINPIPKFGARAANITHTYFDSQKNIIRSDYGFMPVKNATKRDPRIHIAYLTTSSEGYSMMEQGTVIGRKITFHLKQFLRRTFSVGSGGIDLDIREFERRIEILDFKHMTMKIRVETASGTESFFARYRKIIP